MGPASIKTMRLLCLPVPSLKVSRLFDRLGDPPKKNNKWKHTHKAERFLAHRAQMALLASSACFRCFPRIKCPFLPVSRLHMYLGLIFVLSLQKKYHEDRHWKNLCFSEFLLADDLFLGCFFRMNLWVLPVSKLCDCFASLSRA